MFGNPVPEGALDAPAFHRNCAPIWSVIWPLLQGRSGNVLEVGSGTGQHAVAFARRSPHIIWWPSDCDEVHLASIAAWRAQAQLANLREPSRIDIEHSDWRASDGTELRDLLGVVCINVLHIAPWSIAEGLMAGAARHLAKDGRLFVYGPFMRDGRHTAASNAAFDRSLRHWNPQWGVRDTNDVAALARRHNLALAVITEMPANNLTLVFERGKFDGNSGSGESGEQ